MELKNPWQNKVKLSKKERKKCYTEGIEQTNC